jgi:hypothetical protein
VAADFGPVVVPEGTLFFLGDNRRNSSDSRGSLGFVDRDRVIGRAVAIIWPFENAASLLGQRPTPLPSDVERRLKEPCDRRPAASMQGARTEPLERCDMLGRRVATVAGEAVGRVRRILALHPSVAVDLRDDRRGGDGAGRVIAAHERDDLDPVATEEVVGAVDEHERVGGRPVRRAPRRRPAAPPP